MQSIIFGGIWLLFHLVSSILWRIFWAMPVIGHFMARLWLFLADLIHLGFFVIMVFAMVKAFSGLRWDIPYVGPMARKQMGEAP
ncbi:MAG: hypothetical protein QOH88_1671 [Verrucomicrobiota bacterium]|jgi:uncharacterized membrane protein